MNIRNIFCGLVALDLLMLPFAMATSAQIVDSVKFEVKPRAIAAQFPPEPGLTRMFVTSNAPFQIISQDMIGDFEVKVSVSGEIGGQIYGRNAQAPGQLTDCAMTSTPLQEVIYSADRKTALSKGNVVSQAVLIEIQYDEELDPEFKIIASENAKPLPKAMPCIKDMI